MPQFILKINLGNEGMQEDSDIAESLKRVQEELLIENPMYIGESRKIYDINGNVVGSYQVVE